jgi:hypothetical protein
LLNWPFPVLQKHRPAFVAARWTQPGYARPVWGKAPPDVAAPPGVVSPSARPDDKQKKQKLEADPRMAPVTVQQQTADLDLPPAASPAADHDPVADQLTEHLLDMTLPGAALAAKVLGIVSQAAPGTSQTQTTQAPGPGIQAQAQEQDRDREEEREE